MSEGHDGARTAVVTALGANLGIAAAKFVGFALTRSSSMASEAVHSLADCGNQVLLLVGTRQASRAPDRRHPFGYGTERFFWGFFVSVVLFVLGAGFALKEGIDKVLHPRALEDVWVAVGILAVAVVAEGVSLRTGMRESNEVRGELSWPAFIRATTSPDLALVLLEDVAALTGLVAALAGIGLSEATGRPVFDGVASMVIGLVLATVAFVMGTEMKSLLVGEAASARDTETIARAILSVGTIARIIHMRTQHLGPDELLVAVKVAVDGTDTIAQTASAVDEAEMRVREAVPSAHYIFIETDVDRDLV